MRHPCWFKGSLTWCVLCFRCVFVCLLALVWVFVCLFCLIWFLPVRKPSAWTSRCCFGGSDREVPSRAGTRSRRHCELSEVALPRRCLLLHLRCPRLLRSWKIQDSATTCNHVVRSERTDLRNLSRLPRGAINTSTTERTASRLAAASPCLRMFGCACVYVRACARAFVKRKLEEELLLLAEMTMLLRSLVTEKAQHHMRHRRHGQDVGKSTEPHVINTLINQ